MRYEPGQFVWSTTDETFNGDAMHATRESALAEGRRDYPGATIYTGIIRLPDLGLAVPPYLLEDIGERMELPECADGWPEVDEDDLRERFAAWFESYLREKGQWPPTWFLVDDMETHAAKEENDAR